MTKRFWVTAATYPDGDGWHITLDGKPMRLPTGTVLRLRAPALARAVAAEWQAAGGAKGGDFTAADVPLTGLAGAAQERIGSARAAMIETLAGYAGTDLLCYRAATPSGLAARQAASWQPWLDWARDRHGAALCVTTGVIPIAQSADSLAAIRTALESHSDEVLAALGLAIPALGSCVLGLALAARAIGPVAAVALSMLDETCQAESWGADPEVTARQARLDRDVALALKFMALANDRGGAA